ncbi:MAG: hypothetical protein ACP5I8_03105 [Phycisphaerae bacterium]
MPAKQPFHIMTEPIGPVCNDIGPAMRIMTELLKRQQPPAQIMQILAAQAAAKQQHVTS